MKNKKEFKPFIESRESGRIIINPYWLEHLLNLYYQGYIGEVWIEIMDTKIDLCKRIENWGYGIIGENFDKKHLELGENIK